MGEIWHRSLTRSCKGKTEIVEFTVLELEDEGGFPVNSPDCQVLDQSVNHTWKNLKGGLNAKFQKRKPSRWTNGGFVNDVLSSWVEMLLVMCKRHSVKNMQLLLVVLLLVLTSGHDVV